MRKNSGESKKKVVDDEKRYEDMLQLIGEDKEQKAEKKSNSRLTGKKRKAVQFIEDSTLFRDDDNQNLTIADLYTAINEGAEADEGNKVNTQALKRSLRKLAKGDVSNNA
jgi:hypothetical protein